MKKKYYFIILTLFFNLFIYANPKDELYNKLLFNKFENWIPTSCISILSTNNRDSLIQKYPNFTQMTYYHDLEDKYIYWYELDCFVKLFIFQKIDYNNDAIVINSDNESIGLGLFFLINKIDLKNNYYFISVDDTYNSINTSNSNPFYYFPDIDTSFIIILKFDGDYLYVYLNDLKTLYGTFCRINNATLDEYNKLIKTGKCDLSKVTWPRHADGTCDYDGSKSTSTVSKTTTPSTNVAVNKTMTAYKNLKLRSAEATSSSVITVMSSGTKVKILQLGEPEKIDGMNSNWVKVEVQKSAKDRDGKEIKAGTVGWCYGGYLKETANTSSEKKRRNN